ncbi:glycoside hydrolase family 13 protein [Planobispora siamensis]|uniref:Alpha-glycosidase n=1 Tax=Planobispora siamensis TaxID=936338 RepID=A0A8J3SFU5_9ACTN|nr:glycoside hydrolase family 13 protein [Planobispora siamensis]GIH93562.1 alpha-glycosidase [Planobispora siamensis]
MTSPARPRPAPPHDGAALNAPHHDGAALYVADEAPALGDTVTVLVRVPRGDGAERVWIRSPHDGEPVFCAGTVDRVTSAETWWRCGLRVRNPVTGYRFLLDGGPRGYRWLNGAGVHAHDVPDTADFRLSVADPPPDWARDGYVYQIFLDRFARSAAAAERPPPPWAEPAEWDDPVASTGVAAGRQFYGGDLDGVTEHLDHLGALGVDTLYLTPFFPAESNHRYNASSFHAVDPLLGGDEALVRLARQVHARGWHLLGDLTVNHCGDTHPWFRRALADPEAAERRFFYFAGPRSDRYADWLGHPSLPKFRHTSAELRRRLLDGPKSVAGRWLDPPYGLDGWRADVANMAGRHGAEDVNAEVARGLRATLRQVNPQALLLAEHCHDASADLAGDGWHGTMNYSGFTRPLWAWVRSPEPQDHHHLGLPVRTPRLGAESFVRAVRAFSAAVPWRSAAASWSLLGSHDSARIRTVVGSAEVAEVAAGLLFTMVGTPMVFAGDEIGMEGRLGEDARRPFPWHRRDRWDRRTMVCYRRLARLRREHEALRRGGLRWVHAAGDALCFLRESARERLLILAARAPHRPLRLPATPLGLTGEAPNLYGGADPLRAVPGEPVTLPGDGPAFQVWRLT